MKESFRCGVPFNFLFYLIALSHTSARFLHSKPGEEKYIDESINTSLVVDFNEVMGLEDCESGDEDCFKRRVLADAHLDYIYTQHHKP